MKQSMMHKVLFRLYAYDVIEKLGRISLLVEQCEASGDVSPALNNILHQKLHQAQKLFVGEKNLFHILYTDGDGFDEKSIQKERHELHTLIQSLHDVEAAITDISRWVMRLSRPQPQAEAYSFLRNTLPLTMVNGVEDRIVVLQEEANEDYHNWRPQEALFKNVLVEPMALVNLTNPLGWFSLSEDYMEHLYIDNKRKFTASKGKKDADAPTLDAQWSKQLALELMKIRMLGPAYYFYTLIRAMARQDDTFFQTTEPLLFHALNYANFSDKTLVILHEASERYREFKGMKEKGKTSSKKSEDSLQPAVVAQYQSYVASVLNVMEDAIPQRYLFTDKQFNRALSLQERVGEEVMLSATAHYTLSDVREAVVDAYGDEQPDPENPPTYKKSVNSDAIYNILGMVTEEPHSPLEMINAGWVHKVNRAPAWLYDTLQGSSEARENGDARYEGFVRMADRIKRQDSLFLKSFETAEVHRVLLGIGI